LRWLAARRRHRRAHQIERVGEHDGGDAAERAGGERGGLLAQPELEEARAVFLEGQEGQAHVRYDANDRRRVALPEGAHTLVVENVAGEGEATRTGLL